MRNSIKLFLQYHFIINIVTKHEIKLMRSLNYDLLWVLAKFHIIDQTNPTSGNEVPLKEIIYNVFKELHRHVTW